MREYYYIVILSFLILGCTKENLVSQEPGPPTIEFVDIQPRNVVEFKDSISVTFRYSDPDGDLGSENPDRKLVSVMDTRLDEPDYYHLPILAPPGSKPAIKGQLTMKLKNTFLLGSGGDEVTSYVIKVTDRAGNESNSITTPPITISKE